MQGMIARLAGDYGNVSGEHALVPTHFHAAATPAMAGGRSLRDWRLKAVRKATFSLLRNETKKPALYRRVC